MAYSPKNPNGQATMANSEPVVIASDQTDVKITLDSEAVVLGAGSAAIGKLVANSGVDIGDVDITSIAAGDNNIGNVDIVTMPAVTVTGVSTLAEQQTQTTSLQLLDDTVYASDAAISKVIGVGGQFDDTTPGTTTENSVRPLRMSTRRELYTQVRDAAGNERGLNIDASGQLGAVLAAETTKVIGTVRMASGGVASGSFASGSIASGAIASGAIASGAIAAGAIAAGATSIADNEDVARIAADRLVKVAQVRVDAPPSGANVSGTEDYTQFIADVYGKTWVAGSVTEDVAHAAGESVMGNGVRRIDTPASSAGSSGDWATMDATAEGGIWATLTPTTTGGLSVANFNSGDTYTALTNTAQVIKASAGNFYGYYIYNPNSSTSYVMIYNIAAASVTVGTSTAQMVLPIPAGAAANVTFPYPISFSNAGWSIAAATTGGGNTAPTTALEVMIYYK